MNSNTWKKQKNKNFITALAPMYDVTDVSFREIVATTNKPDVMFTEFVNVDALQHTKTQLHKLKFTENQRPIIAQIWGTSPQNHYKAAKLLKKMGFDGIDINMGCPQKKELKVGACAALIENHKLAKDIIEAAIMGADTLPVSIKTRIGLNTISTQEWIPFLLKFNIKAITLHGRTAKQMSKVPANWIEISKAVKIKNEVNKEVLIIGNGDIKNHSEMIQAHNKYSVDGVMIGRGIFENLFAFREEQQEPTQNELLQLLLKHLTLHDKHTPNQPFNTKFLKVYIKEFDGAASIRSQIAEYKSIQDKIVFVNKLLAN